MKRIRLWLARRAFDMLLDAGDPAELEAALFAAPTSFRDQTMTAGPTAVLDWHPEDFSAWYDTGSEEA